MIPSWWWQFLAGAFYGIHLNHLTGYKEIHNSINLITRNNAKLMCIDYSEIKEGDKGNFLIRNETNIYDVIRKINTVKFNIKNGKIINKILNV